MKRLPTESVDMVITSPPYDNLRTYKGFSWDFEGIVAEIFRVLKKGGVAVWIVQDATIKGSETGSSFRQALFFQQTGFNIHDTMIWEKPSFTATGDLKIRYANVFEYMFIFSKGKPKTFNPIKDRPNKYANRKVHGTIVLADGTRRRRSNEGKRLAELGQRFNVWKMPPVNSSTERTGHPAQFPVRLVKDHIISWSNEGDVVLDPFMGSGTSAIACLDTNRQYIGFEISQEYCEMAEKRITQHKAEMK